MSATQIFCSRPSCGAGHLPKILARIEAGVDRLYTSRTLLEELAAVLNYPKISRVLEGRNLCVTDILEVVITYAQIIKASVTPPRVVLDDPDDDHVIECARVAHADYIITGDAHLLTVNVTGKTMIISAGDYLKLANSK